MYDMKRIASNAHLPMLVVQNHHRKQVMTMMLQWGRAVLYLDNPYFVAGFRRGRELYARDCQLIPARATRLTISEILGYVAVPTGSTGRYHFDEAGTVQAEEYLGVFLGYLSGPLPVFDV